MEKGSKHSIGFTNGAVKQVCKVNVERTWSQTSASRLARTTESVDMILDAVDRDCDIAEASGYRSSGKPEAAVKQIATDLLTSKAFKCQPGRNGHNSFPKFPSDLLKTLDYRDMHTWMSALVKTWNTSFE